MAPDATPESLGFVRVPCLPGTDDKVTDLSSVASELGFDQLGFYTAYGTAAKKNVVALASTTVACDDEACKQHLSEVTDAAVTIAQDYEANQKKPADQKPWIVGHLGGAEALVLFGRRGDAYTTVTTTAELRNLIGAVDSPWKAHLFVLTSDSRYGVACSAYVSWNAPSSPTFVRAATPNEVLGVQVQNRCGDDSETSRVLLHVDTTGAPTVSSSAQLWKGSMGCE